MQTLVVVWVDQSSGMTPTIVTYGCLLHLYTKVPLVNTLCYFSWPESVFKILFPFSNTIAWIWQLGKITKALEVSKEMEAQGIAHNQKTFSMIMAGYVQLGDTGNAFSVFEDMANAGIKPDVVTYNILVNAFCRNRQMDRAMQLLVRMREGGNVPTFQTYTTIIDGFMKVGDVPMALEIVHDMKMGGCRPTAATYNVVMNGLMRDGQVCVMISCPLSAFLCHSVQLSGLLSNQPQPIHVLSDKFALGASGTGDYRIWVESVLVWICTVRICNCILL